jgi:uncharacterized protein
LAFTIVMLEAHQSRLKALGVEKLGLFGSFVRGEQRPGSDIDLLVEFTPGKKTFDAFMELCFFWEEILERKVEVVTVESLSPYIGPHILNEVEYFDLAAWNLNQQQQARKQIASIDYVRQGPR